MKTIPNDFAVFVLSHGRPDKVYTIKSLRKAGYTGPFYIVIDNEDERADEYYDLFGDRVVMFDKAAIAETFDEGDNFNDRRAVIYARNACFEIAESLGLTYFMELDDDYTAFDYRFDSAGFPVIDPVHSLDKIIVALLEYFKNTPFFSIAFLQGGDMIGGRKGGYSKAIRTYRKAMNTFLCSTKRKFSFNGRINEDVNTYTHLQYLGNLYLSINNVTITQKTTQKSSGGMAETYLETGTYVKSFYSVMYQPSSVKIGLMGDTHKRLHHSIDWDKTAPCIIPERFRKLNTPGE